MPYLKKSLFIVLLFSLSLFAQAEKIEEGTINELIVLSGIKSQIEDLPTSVVAMIHQGFPNLSNEKKNELAVIFGKVFNSDLVLKDIASDMQKNLTENEAKEVITWYESNTGNRIARAEEDASTPQAMIEFQKAAPQLMTNSELMATVQKLLEQTKVIEETIDIQETVMLATMVGMSQVRNPEQDINVEQLKSIVTMQIDQAKSGVEQMVAAQLAFTYKDIDKASMNEYLSALESPAMKKFNNSNANGLRIALSNALDRLLSSEQSK
tara:strand:- start:759 stop:1559 length:801 start_codon:yes stop_codon:yes gene_type:complete